MTDKVQKIREEVKMVVNRRLNLLNGDYFDLIKEVDGFTNEIMDIINSLQEEPVSINFEQELYKAFGQVKDFTLGMRIAKLFYDMGKNSQESVSEDLEEAAKNVGQKYFPDEYNIWARPNYEAVKAECAFKAGAKWQKEHGGFAR